ncbi:MAG: Sulphatase-modifying factor protein [Bacteroidetes bacterium]|nr:Sulphatase-modifying factor protein [Bacteroidota bacterium]
MRLFRTISKKIWILVVVLIISLVFFKLSCKDKNNEKISLREQIYKTNDSLDLISRDTIWVKIGAGNKKVKMAWSRNTTNLQRKHISNLLSQLIFVNEGSFLMGSDPTIDTMCSKYEVPRHNVQVSSFFISKYEITQILFHELMGYNPNTYRNNNYPMTNISWNEANQFIKKLNHVTCLHFELPTEAQWEYAAKGGNKSKQTLFAGNKDINKVAWYKSNSNGLFQKVGTLAPNELDLCDMSGNVWEWCRDFYAPYTPDSQVNPTGPATGTTRVYRGGSWIDNVNYTRITYRNSGNPDLKMNCLGFRVVLIP